MNNIIYGNTDIFIEMRGFLIRFLNPIFVEPQEFSNMKQKSLNRIKVVLAEKERKNKWLAEKLKVNPVTVSQWCSNITQPSLYTLAEIAEVLDVDISELLNRTKEE